MKRLAIFLFLFAWMFSPAIASDNGMLVIIGGGRRPDCLMEKITELAGGERARIMIIPSASSDPVGVAEYQADQFRKSGAGFVDYLNADTTNADSDDFLRRMDGVTGVFFSGGDQRRLTAALLNTRLLEKIREVRRRGGVIAGTSAGAAVMSRLMITGDELNISENDEPFSVIRAGNIAVSEGFGFTGLYIVDQHFVARKRHNRLMSLVMEHPELPGVGIDESTAVMMDADGNFTVLGESSVIVYDARTADVNRSGNRFSVRDMRVSVLESGDTYQYKPVKRRK